MDPQNPQAKNALPERSAQPMTPASVELDLMLTLAAHAGAELDHVDHRILAALADVGRAHPEQPSWPSRAIGAGERLGLVVVALLRSIEEVIEIGPRQGPMTTIAQLDTVTTAVTITAWRGRKVRVLSGAGEDETEVGWLSADALAQRLGVDIEARLHWVIAEPALSAHFIGEPGSDHSPTPVQRLRGLMRVEAQDLWVVVTYALGVGIFTLATPIAVQALVNTVAFGALLQPLLVLSILLLAGLSFAGALQAMQAWVVEVIQQRWMIRVIGDLAHRLPRVASSGQAYVPELVNRFFDVVTIQKAASSLLLDGLSVVLQAAIGMLVLAFYHPLLLAFDVVLLTAVAAIVFGFGRVATKSAIKESKAKYAVAAWLEEIARHPRTFKGAGGPELAASRSDELARDYLGARRGHFKALFRQIVGALGLQAIASAALLGLGGWLVIDRQLTLGQLVAAELIVSMVVAAFAKFGKHLETYYDLVAAIDKLGALADLPLERSTGESLPPSASPASLRLADIAVADPSGRMILKGIDLEVASGESLAIIGRSASGKSTFAGVLDGQVAPTRGVLEIDGVDLRDRALDDLRRAVSVVGDVEIFAGSLVDNVCLDQVGIPRAAVRRALIDVGLGAMLSRLGGDVEVSLGTDGQGLSQSEALRIGLARAIVVKPQLLVLDGLLDGLDATTRDELRPVLLPERPPWTLLVLTRDPAIARFCQRVVLLEDGALRPSPSPAPSHPPGALR